MCIIDRIPQNICIYIQEIAERMSQGRAVAMVGSGFSKNAQNAQYTEKQFLDWNQLGDIFYKKLYGILPGDEEHPCYYQDVLKLAGKVEQCFGRTRLDKLLLDNLPDEEYEPSELHEALLKLNWTDIFTTNYDTLLERARARVFNKRYQVVLSKDDLVYSKCPRIIKLHGSFPSTRPFILTEEDYRKYPQSFAVFVNTVRQALIENVMCMIGFSGDDPNFLNWIGWVRDYLGNESSSKIYMIGIFDMKETELKLYNSRNIILINMRDCDGIESGQYKEGLKLFFEALDFFQKGNDDEKFWGSGDDEEDIGDTYCKFKIGLKKNFSDLKEQLRANIQKIANEWCSKRTENVDWFVVPYSQREKMEENMESGGALTELFKDNIVLETMASEIGEFLYEYDWRRKQCLLPLKKNRAETYEKYLAKIEQWNEKDAEICFSLLEYFREHGEFREWELLIEQLEQKADETQKKRLYCEQAMKMLYNLECGELASNLIDLSSVEHGIGLEFKISSLLAELGYYERAILLLQRHLDDVRRQTGNNVDYCVFSQEAYLIDLLENMENYYEHLDGTIDYRKDEDSHSRLKMLKSYDCNPEYEKAYLMRRIISRRFNENGIVEYVLSDGAEPEQFIKYMEKTGMVFRTVYFFRFTKEFPALLKGLIHTNPYLALLCTYRYGDKAVCTQIWDKEAVNDMSLDIADNLIKHCINACEKNEEYLRTGNVKENNLAVVIPELTPSIIAGLLQKASMDVCYEVMSFLKKIVTTSDSYFAEINGMLEATLLRLAELEDINIVSRWIDFPLGCREVENGGEILEPFQYIDLNISNATFPTMENIDNLEKKTKSKNKNVRLSAYIRLLVTYIVCDKCDMKSKTLIEAKRFVSNDFRVLSEIIECYEIKCGNEERKKKAKESFLTQIELQIEKISEEGIAYCVDFQKEIARLLQRLEFYHKKCMDFQWNIEEIKVIIKYLDKWADTIQEISQPICYEWDYYKSWCILETILMEILSSSEPKLKHIYHVQLCSLENKLNKLDIPFLLRQIVYEENIDIFRLLFKACQKGKRDRDEAERISFFYKIES